MNFKGKETSVWKIASDLGSGLAHASSNLHNYLRARWKYLGRNNWVVRKNSKFIPE
jgi:hypothetical protein